ncbi:MAG: hypothetical protein J6X44_06560, partial [Thermoguttaceae bacterium]|nr:hypothetical protein [Thermoguttaceae bacterium]
MDSTKTLEEPIASDAASFGAIRAERPNRFVVLFPSERTAQRDSCAKNEELIAANLEKKLNSSVSLTLVIDPSISNRVPSPSKATTRRQYGGSSEPAVSHTTPQNNFTPVSQNSFSEKRNNGVARQASRASVQEIRRQF